MMCGISNNEDPPQGHDPIDSLNRVSVLFDKAIGHIMKEERNEHLIAHLARALELFNEGTLEGVLPLSSATDLQKKRAAFRGKVMQFGESRLYSEFQRDLSQSRCRGIPQLPETFRKLVAAKPHELTKRKDIGNGLILSIIGALSVDGLNLGMRNHRNNLVPF
jgi:hypothetical protein